MKNIKPSTDVDDEALYRAAQYVRMSTDEQKYSKELQAAAIASYAAQRNLTIVRTYVDSGRSGLRASNRSGLKTLISDIEKRLIDFSCLLVYDVSRWGRFQNVDESAYYEFICKKAGIRVVYCQEQFDNDDGFISAIMKNIKRVAAGEYSRELSVKVFAGSCRSTKLGFKQGGTAGYGLQRVLIDQFGFTRHVLLRGDRKALVSDRVVLQPGRADEVKVVRRVFRSFVVNGKSEREIAQELNKEQIFNEFGRPWSMLAIRRMLTCEKYLGHYVYNRKSRKLKGKTTQNPPESWVRCDDAFESIVSVALFQKAGKIIESRAKRTIRVWKSDADMLSRLDALLRKKGRLSARIIDNANDLPRNMTYINRFGSLRKAYELIGYHPNAFHAYDGRRASTATVAQLASDLVARIQGSAVSATFDGALCRMTIGLSTTVSILIARCQIVANGVLRWPVIRRMHPNSDLALLVRMQQDNTTILDYYVIPKARFPKGSLTLRKTIKPELEPFRLRTLDEAVSAIRSFSAKTSAHKSSLVSA